ncbi:type III polyketide synthase [Sandarakinorhabdus sp.]|uniref:type III polyketide synthase n=1 Tax=Sandarakinorhabdus sp. TaxID=1916663 RepID=UPI00286D6A5D|nr:type III polyketide synthase [Sandarakinorhabdus sp.]
MAVAHINRIGTAVPPNDVHEAFVRFVGGMITQRRDQLIFKRMVGRADIAHRWSYFTPVADPDGFTADAEGFYTPGAFPGTAARMARFEKTAPLLAMEAVAALNIDDERARITHLVVASCTGMTAPGIDQLLVKALGLNPGVERTAVGFMGCYAAVNSLRLAHHFVRSDPSARVLVINLELCTLHFQQTESLETLLSMLLFGDGCSAALVTADETGLALQDFRAATIEDSAQSITWGIGDQGFDMHLSGEVPQKIQRALAADALSPDGLLRGQRPEDFGVWAVHAGGRTILDAVENGYGLGQGALHWSRDVLRDFGNMSSATLMFVLQRIMAGIGTKVERDAAGFAVAFGPGLAAESFRFRTVG